MISGEPKLQVEHPMQMLLRRLLTGRKINVILILREVEIKRHLFCFYYPTGKTTLYSIHLNTIKPEKETMRNISEYSSNPALQ
jgi:hypothetical protein